MFLCFNFGGGSLKPEAKLLFSFALPLEVILAEALRVKKKRIRFWEWERGT